MFLTRNKKNNVYPCKPQFYYIKGGFKGSKLYRQVFMTAHIVDCYRGGGGGVLQKVLSLGSDCFSATFYQTYFYCKPSKYSPFAETHFCNFFAKSR